MISRITPKNKYGKYFLAMEAPGDETPKRRVKVINVKPSDNRRTDFTAGAIEEDPPEQEPENMELVPDEDTQDEFMDGAIEEDPNQTPTQDTTEPATTDTQPDENADTGETPDAPDTGTEDDQNMADTTEAQPDTGGDVTTDTGEEATDDPNAPDTGTDTDDGSFADMGGDETGDETGDAGTDDTTTDDTTDDSNGAGIDYDSTRKYRLFKEFRKLADSLDGYISKLENYVSDNTETNQIYKMATEKLRDVRELVTDYMLMRFSANSYVQSLIFFNSQVAAIELVFGIISKSQTDLEKSKH